jgi:hypothetical protein
LSPTQRRIETDILAELDVLAYLHAASISVSVPIHQRDGQRLFSIQAPEGLRYVALFTYAPGQPLSQQCTPPNVRAFGRMLAQVHVLTNHWAQLPPRPPLDLVTLLDRPLTELDRAFGERSAEWAFLRQVASAVRPRIAALPTEPPWYGFHIRLKGHLDSHWSAWFDNMTVANEANGETVLHGLLPDQAALHRVLMKVRDLGLPLLAVTTVAPVHLSKRTLDEEEL